MTLPNLVIAGAPKCGTTSLFDWLVDHPQVCGSSVKEPFYLMDDEHPLRQLHRNYHDYGLAGYEELFSNCKKHHKIVAEATTHYIYQQTAMDVLSALPTKPKLVFVLRKPSERIFSSFGYTKNNQGRVRPDMTFAEFIDHLKSEPEDAARDWVWGASHYLLPRDVTHSRYIDYLSQWRDRVGSDRMRILLFETLRADPRPVLEELCLWLGIDSSFYGSYPFPARNRTMALRNRQLHSMVLALASKVPLRRLKAPLKPLYFALRSKREGVRRSAADEAAMAELDEEFRPYNERLAREFDLNLDSWS